MLVLLKFYLLRNLRYAAHFGSSDVTAAFSLLQTLVVFTSNGISKEVSIMQDGRTTSIQVDTAYVHVTQDGDRLKLYVPEEHKQRQVCLRRQLPITLLQYLGVPDPRKGAELGSIITVSSLSAVDTILDIDGIIEVQGISPPEDEIESDSSVSRDSESITSPSGVPDTSPESNASFESVVNPEINASALSTASTPYSQRSAGYFANDHRDRVNHIDGSLLTPVTSVSDGFPSPPERHNLYKELLDAVIKQARSMEGIATFDDFLIAPYSAESSVDTELAISSSVQGEDLFKIGAAGELFVRSKSLTLLSEPC